MTSTRSTLYSLARFMGDVNAVKHHRMTKRLVNKFIGRKIVSKLWWR